MPVMYLLALAVPLALMACGDSGESGDDDAPIAVDASTAAPDGASPGTRRSAGCDKSGASTGVSNGTLEVRGTPRAYVLSVPDDYDASVAYPLVFGWHGRGSNAGQARSYFGVENAAGGELIMVYPEGLPIANQGGQSGWDLALTGADVELFDDLLATLSDSHCVDLARVFSMGHSFGGYMSNTLGCARSVQLRAIAPVAGGGPFGGCTNSANSGVAAVIVHGDGDTVVPFSQGEGTHEYWQAANSCEAATSPIDPAPCVAHAGCDRPVIWCAHSDPAFGGHGWPAFVPVAIWDLFRQLD